MTSDTEIQTKTQRHSLTRLAECRVLAPVTYKHSALQSAHRCMREALCSLRSASLRHGPANPMLASADPMLASDGKPIQRRTDRAN